MTNLHPTWRIRCASCTRQKDHAIVDAELVDGEPDGHEFAARIAAAPRYADTQGESWPEPETRQASRRATIAARSDHPARHRTPG